MYEVASEIKKQKVVVDLKKNGISVEGFKREFPLEKKKEWEQYHKLCPREAKSRNRKAGEGI